MGSAGPRRRRDGRREQGELDLKAHAADAATLRIDRSQASGDRGQSRLEGSVGAGRQPRAEFGAQHLDHLFEDRADVPAPIVELVEDPEPSDRITIDERRQKSIDGLAFGQPEQVADLSFVDPSARRAEQLVEHRLGIAHPAGGEPGDQVKRGGFGLDRLGLEDARQLALDLGHRQASDIEPLEAGQDRRREFLRVGGGEHEGDVLGRLLERLQERVPGILRDLVGLVEDVDLAAEVGRGVVDPLAQFPDRVDPAVRGRIDLDEVERPSLADGDTRLAGIARVAVTQVRAIEGLRENARQRRLAGAARTDEEGRVRDPSRPDGVAECLDDGPLADDLRERLGPPATVQGLVGRGLLQHNDGWLWCA